MNDFECSTIEELTNKIVADYSNKTLLIYANNGIGKTRTSYCLRKKFQPDTVLCFSAFFEEYFIWNYDVENEEYYLQINDSDAIIHKAIITNGLDADINKNFIYLTNKKININFEIENEKITRITFSLTTGDDEIRDPARFFVGEKAEELPRYPNQKIWPYTDMIQHKLHMVNDIRTGWCRTTPLWGRGLHQRCTGAEYADRLHDCRARTTMEAIMWHGTSAESDAYETVVKFRELSKEDRDAIVKFLDSI